MKVGVVGLGNLGSAIARLTAENGYAVLGWEYDSAVVEEVNSVHKNTRYLPGLALGERVSATTEILALVEQVDIIFVTLPSRFVAGVLSPLKEYLPANLPLVNMSKGIHEKTGETVFQQLSSLFPAHQLAMVAGPSLANEFSRGVFTAVVSASHHPALIKQIQQCMGNLRFSVMASDDPQGVELGGILKNIYALGIGLFEARSDKGMNLIGAYLTQSLKEMTALGLAMGGKASSFVGLSGVGDLITTAMSEHSHNQKMGRLVSSGIALEDIRAEMGVLPEGYNTVKVAIKLANGFGVALPLAGLIHQVIEGQINIDRFLDDFSGILK